MAGGKLSPRQRMINLMYLVFIAMLALNIGKEVLTSFGLMTEKIEASNKDAVERNANFMASLVTKSNEEPARYKPLVTKAQVVKSKGDELYDYIAKLKADMNATVDNPKEYEVKDKPDFLDQKFFNAGGLKPEGKKFLGLIDDYRTSVIEAIKTDYPQIAEAVEHKFSTEKVVKADGTKANWMNYHYEGVPMVATETKLTQLQADIKTTESEVLSAMLQGEMAAALTMDNYSTLMQTPKPAYFSSDKFDGEIVLGRTDNETQPNRVTLTLDGKPLSEGDYTIEGGHVKLNVSAGNVGEHKIAGELMFRRDGEEQTVEVNQSYTVIPMPNSATISADKMNVVYRGVKNPMTISFAGISADQMSASGNGLNKVGTGKYVMEPKSGKEVTIVVNGTLPNGKPVSDKKTFRIKDLPKPSGTFLRTPVDDVMKLPRTNISVGDVGAIFQDFDFDLPLKVNSFKISVPGQPSVTVQGNKMNSQAQSAIKRAKRGDIIQIFDIKASAINNPVKIKNVSPISIEVAN